MVKLVDENSVGVGNIEPLLKIKPLGDAGSIAHVEAATTLVVQ